MDNFLSFHVQDADKEQVVYNIRSVKSVRCSDKATNLRRVPVDTNYVTKSSWSWRHIHMRFFFLFVCIED